MVPEDLRYTEQHEWVARTGADTVRIGITDYAQNQLGDVVFVQLPETGKKVAAEDVLGEVESTKSVSDIYAPLAGEVVAVNEAVVTAPETINTDAFGDGWLVELKLDDPSAVDGLLDAAGYRGKINEG
ncbi:glycine cleavage system protein GcvH [Allokutzneria sp. A3M-2-11 16]|uniref:glycine cleavage system protein GcvH n=1 Tax=Allokutzneria sp. A3M-2-11 16 TaxID=2962043 RepID=UPI0027E339EA|nr:glycine cleavage system protein GcvH [Allokutzneria sp. A3M-2-11 16]